MSGSPHRRPRVLVLVGTRPEAVKMAPVVEALRRRSDEVEVTVGLTGQHDTLIDDALVAFGLEPDLDLAIMREGQTLYDVAHRCLDAVGGLLREMQPEQLLVQGDTASVFFGALAGYFERIRVGHVEAGLRSGRRYAPFPEELFRRMTADLTEDHFAPTPRAATNLHEEGIPRERVHVVGNPVVDALLSVARGDLPVSEPEVAEALERAGREGERIALLTSHRRESFGEPMRRAFRAIREIVDRYEDLRVVFPVHPNPQVREAVSETLAGHDRVHLVQPLSYLDLVVVLRAAAIVFTDSGGIQEEAPTFGVPVLVLREVTERPEGVEAGVARLVGTDPERIAVAAMDALEGRWTSDLAANPYGDGKAGERIADIVIAGLTGAERRTELWFPS